MRANEVVEQPITVEEPLCGFVVVHSPHHFFAFSDSAVELFNDLVSARVTIRRSDGANVGHFLSQRVELFSERLVV